MKLKICAKCSDMFSATLHDNTGKQKGKDYDGYVPTWFPTHDTAHYGDYIILEIDVATGKILNWKKPAAYELKNIFEWPDHEVPVKKYMVK